VPGEKATYAVGDRTISCTNVDRVVFVESGITKGEIINYYRDVADVMVPELRGRPLSMVRYTKGIAGGGFFQKHWQKHYPTWIDSVEISGKTHVIYPICNEAASLVYFANQGAIEMHVCTARGASDHPDELVFDLDPPEGRFDLVRQVARILHELLGELGLPTFVKTSGSKGLHVVAPLDGRASYSEVQALCGAVSRQLCARHEDVVTTEFYKKDRKGRLFLDTMRNSFGSTVVAPYSLRGRPGAPVSTPIEWKEVDDPKLAADGLKLRAVLDRLEAWGDPWSELRAREGSVAAATAALERMS
jgi:bifunctional non-homologous end joining protein LigD